MRQNAEIVMEKITIKMRRTKKCKQKSTVVRKVNAVEEVNNSDIAYL